MTAPSPLKRLLSEDNFQWLIVLCCFLIFAGLVTARALASVGMISVLVVSFIYYGPMAIIKNYLARKELMVLSLFFLIVLFSGIFSHDKQSWLNWVRVKLPYLALPLAFAPMARLSEKKFVAILSGFVVILALSALVVLINYFSNFEAITQGLKSGNAIPIPFPHSHISHIRYTLMLAFAFFGCWYLLEQKQFVVTPGEKWMQAVLMFFVFVAVHVLAVRSSILALYTGIFLLLVWLIIMHKKYALGFSLITLMALIPYAGMKTIPSWKNKLAYMDYDKNQFLKGDFSNLSDGVRLISMQGGIKILQQNLLFGTGAGDLKAEMDSFYNANYPQLSIADHKLPHNQLIWTAATTGLVGLAIFIVAFLLPVLWNSHYKNWLFVVFHVILFTSFFTEATLEEQIGTGFYLTLLLIFMNYFKQE